MSTFKQFLANSTFKRGVVVPSLIFILSVSLVASFVPKRAAAMLGIVQEWIFINLNWVYVWSVTIFVFFLVFLVFSKYGSIKLGDNDAEPEHSFFSWISMLFAAGMGIGLMYFSVAEPISHFSDKTFGGLLEDRKSTRLNSSHVKISYAVFCLKKKNK